MRVHVNAATSADGKIALPGRKPLALSGREDLARVHRLRESTDAILVGVGTVLADDPSLLAKAEHLGRASARQPLRVVLDSRGRTPPDARVLDDRARTLVVTAEDAPARDWGSVDVARCGKAQVDLHLALAAIRARGARSVLVEGGATVIGAFLAARLVHEMTVYVAPVVVGGGAPSLVEGGFAPGAPPLALELVAVERLGEGALLSWRPRA